jgi:hypothetical protein
LQKYIFQMLVMTSDRPKFGSAPVPAKILTGTEILVLVPAKFELPVPAGISVQI